jgi:hypothetical protein
MNRFCGAEVVGMAVAHIEFILIPRWWVKYYLAGVCFMSDITGLEPDTDKVGYWLSAGFQIVIKK